MTDLGNFCKNIINSKELEDEQVKEAAKKVINELENTVIAEKHSSIYYNATGLTIQLNDSVFTSSEYDSLDFAKDTGWKNLIKYIYNK